MTEKERERERGRERKIERECVKTIDPHSRPTYKKGDLKKEKKYNGQNRENEKRIR